MKGLRDWLKLGLLVIFYITLALFNIYNATLIFLFPVIAIPLTIYLMGNKKDMTRESMIHIIIGAGIFLVSNDYRQALLYFISVVIPSYLVISLYRKSVSVPKIIMTIGVSMGASLIIYVVIMKYLGIDYIKIYLNALDQFKSSYIQALNMLLAEGFTSEDVNLFKEMITAQVVLLKMVYPALFMLSCIFLSLLYIAIITLVGNIKGWRLPTLKQVFHFRLSKFAAALIILGVLGTLLDPTEQVVWSMAGLNLYFLFSSLFQLMGIIAAIMIIRKSNLGSSFKVIGIIVSIMIFYTMPVAMTVVGLGDSLFNYRKVENVV